nr:acyltransferase family protein [uncultured Acetatifactor sp.]
MRQRWIDVVKGIAMVCVILGHSGGVRIGTVNLNDYVYVFHLPVFFMISGYNLKKRKLNNKYIRDKFERLMFPYFMTCFGIMVMDCINSVVISHDASIKTITYVIYRDFVRSFWASGSIKSFVGIELGTRIGAIWFLPGMFFSLLIVQGILQSADSIGKRYMLVGISFLAGYITSQYFWLPFSIQAGMTAAFFVMIGYDVYSYEITKKLRWYHYVSFLVLLIFGTVNGYNKLYIVTNNYPDLLVSLAIAVSSGLLIFWAGKIFEKCRVLGFIGRNSLQILCLHLFALEVLSEYFRRILAFFKVLQGNAFVIGVFLLNLCFAVSVAAFIRLVEKWVRLRRADKADSIIKNWTAKQFLNRDVVIDILKGILIISMIIGHAKIDEGLRSMIYSCHMVASVFCSGYCHKSGGELRAGLVKLCKNSLVPYIEFCIIHMVLHRHRIDWFHYFFGISFAKNWFSDVQSIGPIYFVLLLFLVKLIYMLIDKFLLKERWRLYAVVGLAILGIVLGKAGLWMPWSLDISLYCLIFYYLGICCRRYCCLEYIKTHPAIYFILSPVWVYMIYDSSMEIAVRQYAPYGIVIIGAMCGIALLYALSAYIHDHLSILGTMMGFLGKNTMYILVVHTLFSGRVSNLLSWRFDSRYIWHMCGWVVLQLILGGVVGCIIGGVRNWQRYYSKRH